MLYVAADAVLSLSSWGAGGEGRVFVGQGRLKCFLFLFYLEIFEIIIYIYINAYLLLCLTLFQVFVRFF